MNGNGQERYVPIGFHFESGGETKAGILCPGLRRFSFIFPGMTSFYEEKQPWGKTCYEINPNSYKRIVTSKQTAEFFYNLHFGDMFFLDGVLQSTTADQDIYHSAMASLAQSPRKVLIGGSAEGWLAEKLLKSGKVHHVTMVDWDSELVNWIKSQKYWAKHIWEDERFRYVCKDIKTFAEETKQSFDTVFLDLLDIETKEEVDFMTSILRWVGKLVLQSGNTIVMNVGRSRETAEAFAQRDGFLGTVHEILVPSFQEPWYLVKLVRN